VPKKRKITTKAQAKKRVLRLLESVDSNIEDRECDLANDSLREATNMVKRFKLSGLIKFSLLRRVAEIEDCQERYAP
jgi:hypothetical protein